MKIKFAFDNIEIFILIICVICGSIPSSEPDAPARAACRRGGPGSGGVRDKAATLAGHRDGIFPAESYEALETKVRIYGDTAVVNGLSRWKAGNSSDLRITSVYIKRNGTWRCVSWQGMVVGD